MTHTSRHAHHKNARGLYFYLSGAGCVVGSVGVEADLRFSLRVCVCWVVCLCFFVDKGREAECRATGVDGCGRDVMAGELISSLRGTRDPAASWRKRRLSRYTLNQQVRTHEGHRVGR